MIVSCILYHLKYKIKIIITQKKKKKRKKNVLVFQKKDRDGLYPGAWCIDVDTIPEPIHPIYMRWAG